MNQKEYVEEMIAYVKKQDIHNLSLGKYDIDGKSYFSVQEYMTKTEDMAKVEAHKNFVDVQMIIKGKERMRVWALSEMTPVADYNPEKDVRFYAVKDGFKETIVSDGAYEIYYPEDAHQPGLFVEESSLVRKVLIKVRVL